MISRVRKVGPRTLAGTFGCSVRKERRPIQSADDMLSLDLISTAARIFVPRENNRSTSLPVLILQKLEYRTKEILSRNGSAPYPPRPRVFGDLKSYVRVWHANSPDWKNQNSSELSRRENVKCFFLEFFVKENACFGKN